MVCRVKAPYKRVLRIRIGTCHGPGSLHDAQLNSSFVSVTKEVRRLHYRKPHALELLTPTRWSRWVDRKLTATMKLNYCEQTARHSWEVGHVVSTMVTHQNNCLPTATDIILNLYNVTVFFVGNRPRSNTSSFLWTNITPPYIPSPRPVVWDLVNGTSGWHKLSHI